ncbi:hypothetical protein KIN20_007250 [Parelaphostrongylus tenuis]|uniref:Protein-tyrosine phosphatase n=1 Tax=Parelaphostrongylus tenuis TaxID=148309 RepID=A0AAD5M333_PARTN|nr:hypothetical protein KIN20_007250 [Parelaphostrongylus tenuis]
MRTFRSTLTFRNHAELYLDTFKGPLDNTQLAFWAMVIQEESECIIMLCNTIECGKFKCSQYWPREKGETMSVGEGEGRIFITNLDVRPLSEVDSFVRVCRLKLDYIKDGKEMSSLVTHYQWENWPDRGVPPTNLTATELLSAVRGTTKPIIIHCSAGIGRTGTIAAIAYVQDKMQHGQYIYVHRVLLAYFLEKYRDRFAHILSGDGEAKYAKWLEDYRVVTGCN